MSDTELAAIKTGGVTLLPMTAGSIVLSYNLPGITGQVQLPRDVYPAIFLGEITKWNDPKIAAANPGMQLPDLPITVAYRADGSGTTYNFTNHLARHQPGIQGKGRRGQAGEIFPSASAARAMKAWRCRSSRRPGRSATSSLAMP